MKWSLSGMFIRFSSLWFLIQATGVVLVKSRRSLRATTSGAHQSIFAASGTSWGRSRRYTFYICIILLSLHNFKKLLNVLIKIQLRFLRQRYKYFKIYKFDWKYATQKSSYHKLCRTITTVKKFTRLILKLSITLDLILLYIFKIFLCDKTQQNKVIQQMDTTTQD